MKQWLSAAALAALVFTAPVLAQTDATQSPALQKLLDRLSKQHTPEGDQIVTAITDSPSLAMQIDSLLASHKLKQIDIAASNPGKVILGDHLIFDSGLLSHLRSDHPHENAVPGSPAYLLADNTVFVLGHLAWHVAHDNDGAAAQQAAMQDAMAHPMPGGGINLDGVLGGAINGRMRNEASAFLQGWNDTVDAAARAKGAPLTPKDAADLLLNLRYRSYFLAALPDSGDRLGFTDDGHLPLDDHNLNLMAKTLRTAAKADFD